MRFTVCESSDPPIKATIEEHYIPWYCKWNSCPELWQYTTGLQVISLPLICIIDPNDSMHYLDRTEGQQMPDVFYERLQKYEALETVRIDVRPDALNTAAPWTLAGPNGYSRQGAGDAILQSLDPGDYTITWGDLAGWTKPAPAWETLTLENGKTITFTGSYCLTGDLSGNGNVAIADGILVLQIMSGLTPAMPILLDADVNGDVRIGLPEAIYILQKVAGMR